MRVSLKLVNKGSLKTITRKTPENPRVRTILRNIYYGLLEISYDLKKDEFSFNWNNLSYYTGLSKSTLRRYIHILDEFAIIEIADKKKSNNCESNHNIVSIGEVYMEKYHKEVLEYENSKIKDEITGQTIFSFNFK